MTEKRGGNEENMRGIFLLYNEINEKAPNGIERKILGQIACLRKSGFDCEAMLLTDGRENMQRVLANIAVVLPSTNLAPRWALTAQMKNIQFMYFRRPPFITKHMRRFLKKIRTINSGVKVIMEVPTYPYDLEYNSLALKALLLKDKYNRRKLQGLIDRFAVISDEELTSLWGVPVIPFKNGYDVSSVRPRKKKPADDSIHLGCVAMFMLWHGYERLLNGMIKYYEAGGKRSVIVHMVGEGEELIVYKRIAEHPILRDKVIFHGMLSGDALDSVYDLFDFGVISLGVYKINSNVTSALKSESILLEGFRLSVAVKLTS